jgi:hypothetical protein
LTWKTFGETEARNFKRCYSSSHHGDGTQMEGRHHGCNPAKPIIKSFPASAYPPKNLPSTSISF